ncbi:MAG: nucleotide exchange factor GrpE [Desulfobacterales bacterium S5133MH16]|nr:MAG: nucleotide exchange factor GrpE [Desulfobacterales bacterium S5133MH16]
MGAKKKTIEINTEIEENGKKKKISKEIDSGKEDKEKNDDPLKVMEASLESMEQESKDSHDRFLRVSAEFENYKKRAAREMNDFRKFANESFVKAMLPVVDNLDRAIESSSDDDHSNSSVVEGVNMTLKEILKIFEQFGVKPFASLGKTFDPALHQAVMQEESDDHPEKTILNELEKGYMMHDRLLRPAMVVVSKKTDSENQENRAQEE